MGSDNQTEDSEKTQPIKKCVDLQRMKLEKLMKNFDKPVIIPERPKEKSFSHVPEFIRNVMGSSAGAGSGEFHVYRHLRRKEYARQKYIQQKSEKELLDEAYKKKVEENVKKAEERTAKKRAKRLKQREKIKLMKIKVKKEDKIKISDDSEKSDYSDKSELENATKETGNIKKSNDTIQEEIGKNS